MLLVIENIYLSLLEWYACNKHKPVLWAVKTTGQTATVLTGKRHN